MLYRPYGDTGKQVSLVGMGTARLSADPALFSSNVELVLKAASMGVNYFDTAPTYASGVADKILGEAFSEMKGQNFYVSSKSMLSMDPTASDVLRRIEAALKILHVEKITFFHMWSVLDVGQYRKIIAPGGPYEGALRAKEEGLVEHICFSAHCDGQEIAQIINDRLFEGVTLGFNAINYRHRLDGLKMAKGSGLGTAIMNPLAGGMIPANPDYFRFLNRAGNSVVDSAIQFVAAHQEVSTILIGVNNLRDLTEAVSAISRTEHLSESLWHEIVSAIPEPEEPLCTMCDYCRGCPAGLPVNQIMGTYNEYILSSYDEKHFHEYRKMFYGQYPFETLPCIKCGHCERKCTQHLPIISRIEKINAICNEEAAKQKALLQRFFPDESYPKTGIYGLSIDAETMLKAHQNFFGGLPEQIEFFDSNPAKWGNCVLGSEKTILPPSEIKARKVKRILITATKYAEEITQFLKDYVEEGTEIDVL
ncbi:hypothetical protein EV210_10977 [Anaerospora hongkongensis]|uniref:4Fe-4S ferredoxin-type domain-containing protein n=1 Tax=Anaerospora hongkongensis TaxID=244830 RepID=A0A4R1PWU0_9FIRM|nr:aldo/keto reductase [Anaerospora hongkongensis]TCL36128.1 hypothetical protein EV210_10977 [Anaerospora hongkongensis]